MSQEQNEKKSWTEIIPVSGEDLLNTVKGLLNEVGVRRVVVRKKNGDILVDIPLYLGLAGLLIFRFWALVPVAAGLLADYSIEVTREGKSATEKEEITEIKLELTSDQPPSASRQRPMTDDQPATPDDLTQINGIGPKVAGLLNESGIITFAQLAAASVADLQAILDKAGPRYRIVDPTDWSQQAAEMVTSKA